MENLETCKESLGLETVVPLAHDASTRRYFRSSKGILMVDEGEGAQLRLSKFIDVAQRLKNANLHVPEIYEILTDQNAILLEDLGGLSVATAPSVENFDKAVSIWRRFEGVESSGLPLYDRNIYREELSRICRFYLKPFGIENAEILDISQSDFEQLEEQSKRFVHVDFHVENLMLAQNADLAIIDFQDARIGHVFYDMVSLVDDVRIEVPQYIALKLEAEALELCAVENGKYWFDLLSAQRLLKIIGIFARLHGEGHSKYGLLMGRCFELLDRRLQNPSLNLWREWRNDVVPSSHEWFKRLK